MLVFWVLGFGFRVLNKGVPRNPNAQTESLDPLSKQSIGVFKDLGWRVQGPSNE